MDAAFSIELGWEDPVLDFPWTDPEGKLAYRDLKRHPELLVLIEEAERFPELGEFLRVANSAPSMLETAKCDVWATVEMNPEEEIYDASHKFASYVDVVFSGFDLRRSLSAHERFAQMLVDLLRRAPEIPSAAELCVRRCYLGKEAGKGFCCTLYLSGYGNEGTSARRNWAAGLKLMESAVLQLSSAGLV